MIMDVCIYIYKAENTIFQEYLKESKIEKKTLSYSHPQVPGEIK